jgi:inner membrane protein
MTLAAEAPDLDVLWGLRGPVYGFAHHRGFTHSFLGLIFVAAAVTGFMYLVWRLRGRKTNILDLAPKWGRLFGFAYIAGLSHILLDYTNNYGIRPFWPVSEAWYSWDIVFIVEPALYIILIGGLALPVIFSRRQPRPRGRSAAMVALVSVVALYAARDHEHRKAVDALEHTRFHSAPPVRVSAYPYYWHLFRWYGVAETKEFFASGDIDSRSEQLNLAAFEYRQKPAETPAALRAKRSYLGRTYLGWAQYPLVTQTGSGQGWRVTFEDLRFAYPGFRGRIALSASVELDSHLKVIGERFGDHSQRPPID